MAAAREHRRCRARKGRPRHDSVHTAAVQCKGLEGPAGSAAAAAVVAVENDYSEVADFAVGSGRGFVGTGTGFGTGTDTDSGNGAVFVARILESTALWERSCGCHQDEQ